MTGPAYTLKPKAVCVPKFTVKIEGNAVEEGAKVFFEGIVDAQPPPGKLNFLSNSVHYNCYIQLFFLLNYYSRI